MLMQHDLAPAKIVSRGLSPWWLRGLGACTILLLTGCATSGRHLTGWSGLTLRPGDTATCQSNPCQIFFEMPEGSGNYRLTGTGYTIG